MTSNLKVKVNNSTDFDSGPENADGFQGILNRRFKITERGSNIRTEILAGVTIFATCAYILAVNPAILSAAGMDARAVFWATVLSAGLATIGMGLFANFPFALAPAMGLNAYFAFYVVGSVGLSWQNALACVMISGVVFVILSLLKIRSKIVNEMPDPLKHGIGAGIGLFIAFAGLSSTGVIVKNQATIVGMGDLGNPSVVLMLLGLALSAILVAKRVKGGLLISILVITGIGLFVTDPKSGLPFTHLPEGGLTGLVAFDNPFTALAPTFGELTFNGLLDNFSSVIAGVIFIVFSFVFVDLFDTIGVIIGVGTKAGLMNEKGELPNAEKALWVDAVATVGGSILGTSTVTTYGAESAAGIAEGGKTGLTAVTCGLMFLAAIIFAPLFLMIPAVATAPALVMIGVFMMEPLIHVKLDDMYHAFPVFLAVFMMPVTFSIAHGILFGVLGYTAIRLFSDKRKEISPTMWVLTAIFAGYMLMEALH